MLHVLVWENIKNEIELFDGTNSKQIIQRQRRFINRLGIQGKRRYRSVEVLRQYLNTGDRVLAKHCLELTLERRCKSDDSQ